VENVVPVNPLDEVWEALDSIEARLDALEAAAKTRSAELTKKEAARDDELSKLAWAAKHGRQRPW
jgi:hypothetical protein